MTQNGEDVQFAPYFQWGQSNATVCS